MPRRRARSKTLIKEAVQREQADLPKVFCWTKMGAEAGQSLDEILRRKELERSAGEGTFAWGIGNSLGTAAARAQGIVPNGEVDVVFTLMKSAAREIDRDPRELLLWTSFEDEAGVRELPPHVVVTSRGGESKRSHYALVCHSERSISNDQTYGVLDAGRVKNFLTMNPVGSSQVTSIVTYEPEDRQSFEQFYDIAFRAKLQRVGFVRLSNPVELVGELQVEYDTVCNASTVDEWKNGAHKVRELARSRVADGRARTSDMFSFSMR